MLRRRKPARSEPQRENGAKSTPPKSVAGTDEFGKYRDERGVRLYKWPRELLEATVGRIGYLLDEAEQGNTAVPFGRPGYFEFGVYHGRAAHSFANYVASDRAPDNVSLPEWSFVLFDSWEGLPDSDDPADVRVGRGEGQYTGVGPDYALKRLHAAGVAPDRARTVDGWFEDTLTEELRDEIRQAGIDPLFVCIDCDYYSSTATALEWLRPLLKPGALLYFDDLFFYYGSPNKGERKAINEFNEAVPGEGLTVDPRMDQRQHRVYMFWRDSQI